MDRVFYLTVLLVASSLRLCSQDERDTVAIEHRFLDSLYIAEVERLPGKPKMLHAEPLYIDLIRDLGARKGEREWNVGLGMTDQAVYNQYSALIEYEFAPVNRLGLEVELPFSIYLSSGATGQDSIPRSQLNSLKMAVQYTFHVSEKRQISLAFGTIYEMGLTDFSRPRETALIKNHLINPFFIAAKRWGRNFHTLIYTGPYLYRPVASANANRMKLNYNVHYMISGTRNFVGLEVNQSLGGPGTQTILRPQMRVGLTDRLLVGIVSGIPLSRKGERLSSFLRVIYEPNHRSVRG
jgi:hypothetical protein